MAHPLSARRRVLRLWLAAGGVPPERVDFDAVERVEGLLRSAHGSRTVTLPGLWVVQRHYDRLTLKGGKGTAPGGFASAVQVPGETMVPGPGLRVVTAVAPGLVKERGRAPGRLPARASLGRPECGVRELLIRSWRPGDRMRPLGVGGSKKVHDILVDAKVSGDQRPGVPLFECRGEIVWIPGYRVAEGWEVTDPSEPALQVFVERI